jgi:hypothetical protein
MCINFYIIYKKESKRELKNQNKKFYKNKENVQIIKKKEKSRSDRLNWSLFRIQFLNVQSYILWVCSGGA